MNTIRPLFWPRDVRTRPVACWTYLISILAYRISLPYYFECVMHVTIVLLILLSSFRSHICLHFYLNVCCFKSTSLFVYLNAGAVLSFIVHNNFIILLYLFMLSALLNELSAFCFDSSSIFQFFLEPPSFMQPLYCNSNLNTFTRTGLRPIH